MSRIFTSGANVSFELDIDSFVDTQVSKKIIIEQKRIAEQAFRRIVQLTPKDTGNARNNWQLTINEPAEGLKDNRRLIGDALDALKTLKLGDIVFITNNVDYIVVLEYGLFDPPDPGPSKDPRPERFGRILVEGGFSTQAPNGMVAITEQELIAFYGDFE